MPTYDYACANCDHRWELFQPITAKPVRKCPSCGRQRAKRMIGPGAGVIFRGSGFYQTDYRSDSYRKAAAADKKAQEGKDGKADASSKSESSSSGDSKGQSKAGSGD